MKLSVKDAAALMGVAPKTIYRWIQDSGLPAYRIEGQYRLNRTLLLEWSRAKRINVAAPLFDEPSSGPMPSLADTLRDGGIFYRVEGSDVAAVLRSVVGILRLPEEVDREFILQALLARERLQSTGIGDGFAIPHVRNPVVLEVDKPSVALCFLEKAIEFGSLDGQPVQTLFTLACPNVRTHLHLLSRLSFCLQDPAFKVLLKRQATREEILGDIQRIESSLPAPGASQESRSP